MKRYTDDELLNMDEAELELLAGSNAIDDDDWQRWHDLREDAKYFAELFVKTELQYYT